MEIIAAGLGLIVGGIVGAIASDYILLLYYHGRYRSEDDFLKLYDAMSERFHFEMFAATLDKSPKDYASFKKLHSQRRSDAFKKYKSEIRMMFSKAFLVIALATTPAQIVFREDSWIYLLAFAAILAGLIAYKRLIRKFGVEFYAILMLTLVLKSSS